MKYMKKEQIARHVVQAAFLALLAASGAIYRGTSSLFDYYILIFLVGSVFCGWVCPFGSLQELAGAVRSGVKIKRLSIPPKIDIALSVFRYVPLVAAVGALAVLDVRKPFQSFLSGGSIGAAVATVVGLFFLASVFIDRPFCRWFCSKGATMGILSLGRALTIKRDGDACSGCGVCSRACPMGIGVHKRAQVVDPRCIDCLACVSKCPRKGALKVGWRKYAGAINAATALLAAVFLLYMFLWHE